MIRNGFLTVRKRLTAHGSVIDYLGKYTHRIAISNHRIICMDDENVTFSVKDYRNKGQWKELTLSGVEFIRRFLMHVPPKRFVRIRHYGLLCSRSKRQEAYFMPESPWMPKVSLKASG